MSDAQVAAEVSAPAAAAPFDPNAKWPYEAKDDGALRRARAHAAHAPQRRFGPDARLVRARAAIWKTHDALRADLSDLKKALEAMETAEASGEPRGSRVRPAARTPPQSTLPRCAWQRVARSRGAARRSAATRLAKAHALTEHIHTARAAAAAADCPRSQLWMLTNLKKWFHAFEHNYKHHFEVQDKFFFPLRASPGTQARPPSRPRLTRPRLRAVATKVSKDELHASGEMSHAKVLALLQHLSAALAAQSTQAAWDLTTIKSKFAALDEGVRAHLEAVEKGPIELMRREMSHKDVKWALEKHVVSDGSKQDVGWLLARAFNTDAARDDWLARVPVMPLETRKNGAIPAAHAYLNGTHKMLKEIIAGKHTAGGVAAADAGGCCVIA